MTDRGAKYSSGDASSGSVILIREDGTTSQAPFWLIAGSIIDNGDGTATLTVGE